MTFRAGLLRSKALSFRCPAEQAMPFEPGGILQFPKETCAQCPLKAQCTTSAKGRSVDKALLIELRERQQTLQGRAQLRERVAVEHALAHVGRSACSRTSSICVGAQSSTTYMSWLVPSNP